MANFCYFILHFNDNIFIIYLLTNFTCMNTSILNILNTDNVRKYNINFSISAILVESKCIMVLVCMCVLGASSK